MVATVEVEFDEPALRGDARLAGGGERAEEVVRQLVPHQRAVDEGRVQDPLRVRGQVERGDGRREFQREGFLGVGLRGGAADPDLGVQHGGRCARGIRDQPDRAVDLGVGGDRSLGFDPPEGRTLGRPRRAEGGEGEQDEGGQPHALTCSSAVRPSPCPWLHRRPCRSRRCRCSGCYRYRPWRAGWRKPSRRCP